MSKSDIKFFKKITKVRVGFWVCKYEKQEESFSSLVESSSIDRIVKRYTVRSLIENKNLPQIWKLQAFCNFYNLASRESRATS